MHVAADTISAIREEFFVALRQGDAAMAELIGLDAVAGGLSVADVYVDVIGPALAAVGHQWEKGEMSIADEHLATGIAYDVMKLLGRMATSHPRRSRERVLLAAVEAENHVTGLRMVGDLAEGAGFDVRYLGAAVPVGTLAPIVAKQAPEIVGLSVTMPGSAAQLAPALEQIVTGEHAPKGILVGGRGVPEALRGDLRVRYVPDAREALAVIESLADPVD